MGPAQEKEKTAMKKTIFLILGALILSGCATNSTSSSLPTSEERTIAGADMDPNGGADLYAGKGNHSDSPYYGHPDYYALTSNDHLTILSHYKTFQQTAEYTCGPAAILTALYHLGITRYTERALAIGMKTSCDQQTGGLPGTADEPGEIGTSIPNMVAFLKTDSSLKIEETSYRENYSESDLITSGSNAGNLKRTFESWAPYASGLDEKGEPLYVEDAKNSRWVSWLLAYLKKNLAITILWGDWDGHYQDIIGYDTMGTPAIGDDVLILADSYDTSDHDQDGYYAVGAERFFAMWVDRNIVSKPYQVQQFLILNKAA
jgi:hypothetical protein